MEIYTDGACNSHTGTQAWGSVIGILDGTVYDLLASPSLAQSAVTLAKKQLPANTKIAAGERTVLKVEFNDVKTGQNNGAELVSFTLGLQLALEYKAVAVYTDSDLIYSWWSTGHINPKTKKKMDPRKLEWIQECAILRAQYEKREGKVKWIPGATNPADLGWH